MNGTAFDIQKPTMRRFIFLPFLLLSLSFSSCIHHPATDAGADEALGLGTKDSAAEAQQELSRSQEAQQQEQRRQLERQITDPRQ